MKIQNSRSLGLTENRRAALAIAEAGLQSIDTERLVRDAVRLEKGNIVVQRETLKLKDIRRVFVAGVGKCSVEAARALEAVLGDTLTSGVVIDIADGTRLKKIRSYVGTHPLPSEQNAAATRTLIDLLRGAAEDDLVIFIVSGGGSTLLSQPVVGSIAQEAELFRALSSAGATIQEINTVRKHASLARGGRLAQYAYPARSLSLIFSDVPGDDVQFVASGPTIKDATTVADAQAILSKYGALEKGGIKEFTLVETPKENKYFEKTKAVVVASNEIALWAMAEEARKHGFAAKLSTTRLAGEARDVARSIVSELRKESGGSALLYGGETTVTVRGRGSGGRNMELALAAALEIQEGEVILSLASDGHDNSDYAGALCDTITVEKARRGRLDARAYLAENDGHAFFKTVGDYILTGDTGSNVSDLIIALKR